MSLYAKNITTWLWCIIKGKKVWKNTAALINKMIKVINGDYTRTPFWWNSLIFLNVCLLWWEGRGWWGVGAPDLRYSGTPVLRYSGNGLVQLTTTQSTPLRQPARPALFYSKDRREERENLIVVLSVPSLFFPTFLLEVVSLRYSLVLWLS